MCFDLNMKANVYLCFFITTLLMRKRFPEWNELVNRPGKDFESYYLNVDVSQQVTWRQRGRLVRGADL